MPRRLLTSSVAAALVLGACGGTASTEVARSTTTTTSTTVATTTTAPPPATVIVAGDSIIYDVAPALVAALDPDSTTVVPVIAPQIAATTSREPLLRQVEETSADLVVVMVGVWERGHLSIAGLRLGEPGWAEAYAAEVLDPTVDTLLASGSRLLILGPPHLRDQRSQSEIDLLEEAWSAYADRRSDAVRFADADEWLGTTVGYTEIETADDGTSTRLRRTDGIHLCEEGARRIARGVLGMISEELGSTTAVVPGWETAAWTDRFPDDECPQSN